MAARLQLASIQPLPPVGHTHRSLASGTTAAPDPDFRGQVAQVMDLGFDTLMSAALQIEVAALREDRGTRKICSENRGTWMSKVTSRSAMLAAAVAVVASWPLSNSIAAPPRTADGCATARYLFFFRPEVSILFGSSVESSIEAHAATEARALLLLNRVMFTWRRAGGPIAITGHEDGAEALKSREIGRKRADALRLELIKRGIDPTIISTQDVGDAMPIFRQPAGTAEEQNRFAEVWIENARMTCITADSP